VVTLVILLASKRGGPFPNIIYLVFLILIESQLAWNQEVNLIILYRVIKIFVRKEDISIIRK